MGYFKQNPTVVQIGQIVSVTIDGALHFLLVTRLHYLRDSAFIRKVLDINDDHSVLPTEVEVSELTFNEHSGYLMHEEGLKSLTLDVINRPAMITIPKNAVSFGGIIDTLDSLSNFKDAVNRLR